MSRVARGRAKEEGYKPWRDGEAAGDAKQLRLTSVFAVRMGPAAPGEHKAPKAAATTTAATERTKARAARTAAVTTGAARGHKRRNRPAADSDAEAADGDVAVVEPEQSAKQAAAGAPLRRSTRAAAAAAQPKAAATGAGRSAKPRAGGAAAAGAAKGSRRRGASTAPRYFSSWEVGGQEYSEGDDVYVVETEDTSLLPEDDEDEDCCVCGKNTNPSRMVECDRCLRGFHFRCLKPPLKALPDGDWACPDCERGVPPSASGRRLHTCSQAFLFGQKILGLARICGWMRSASGEVEVLVRHYLKPEETHLGRQKHHQSREVFLGVAEHVEPADCIWGPAKVVAPAQFGDTEGTDVFICEYEYDDRWKRFRRCIYGEDGPAAAASDDDEEWGAAAADGARRGRSAAAARKAQAEAEETSSSDSGATDLETSESDEEYKPKNTLDGWVIRKPRPGQAGAAGAGRGGRGRGHAYAALLDEDGTGLLQHAGASAVPERETVGPLAAARRALALNNAAGGLPCRDAEKTVLRRFIGQSVEDGADSPGVLYICGVPGTGKTACVMEVLRGVRQQAQQSGVQLVILNALQLPSPQHVYCKLWERMSGQRWGPARALKALEELFSGGATGQQQQQQRHVTLLIVDEIDVLITKDQAVLYNLFEWPMRPAARLAVIGISNTHDLDSRVLPRIASRLSGSKLAFNPYNNEQLNKILSTRLQGVSAVAPGAITFCARKVAGTTGDVRRALELLRRATEIAETQLAVGGRSGGAAGAEMKDVVTAQHATEAIKEMYGSAHMTLLRACGLAQKLVLVALLAEMRAQNKPEVTAAALHHRLITHLALLTRAAELPLARVVEAAATLGAQRLIIAAAGWQGPNMRVSLNVPQEDVKLLLREDPQMAPVQACVA